MKLNSPFTDCWSSRTIGQSQFRALSWISIGLDCIALIILYFYIFEFRIVILKNLGLDTKMNILGDYSLFHHILGVAFF